MAGNDLHVLHTLYDRLFDAITYAPASGQPPPFNKTGSMIQFASMQALRDADFANAFSALNPNGDMRVAETFSRMVDALPVPQLLWADSNQRLSDVYRGIVTGANSLVQVDEQQAAIYKKAFDYLNVSRTMKDFMGNETTQVVPTAVYSAYQTNQQSYIAALSSYRLSYGNYNLDDPRAQREFNAREPVLAAAINAAWNNLQQGGAPMVEQALAALATTVNSAIRSALAQARQTMGAAGLASMTGAPTPWYLAYATPSNWADPSALANMSEITVDSGSLHQTADASFDQYSAGLSASWGLWSVGATGGHSKSTATSQMTASAFKMRAHLGLVRIYRPWYNPVLFSMQQWFVDSYARHGISDGQGNGVMPLVPSAMIVARDFELSGSFSQEDKSHIESAVNGGASVGWGPFKIGGSYSHSESHDRLDSSFDGTTLKVPGLQVVGYVNAIVPPCPPMDKP